MGGVQLSRWSMSYFAAAVVSLITAEGLWASGLANPLRDIGNPWVLVDVHLTTIGFLTLLMLGALHQFVPVLTETELASHFWSGVTLYSVVVGLLGMLAGFLSLPGGAWPIIPWLLPAGGSLVIIGVITAAINLGLTLKRAWPWTLSGWLVASGLVYLLVTVMVGLLMALALSMPHLFATRELTVLGGRGLAAHVIGGVGGWLTLTAMGVSYKLLAMFTLSDEYRGLMGWTAYVATALGVALTWVSQWMNASLWVFVGWTMLLGGLALFVWDMRALYAQRKRRQLELNARFGIIPLGVLAVLIVVAAIVGLPGTMSRWDIALVFMALYGWLGGLALTQLYKIVPFLTWLDQFGNQMGKARVPRVQDLVNEPRDRYAYLGYFLAVVLATLFLAVGWFEAFRVAMGVALVVTLDIARALYHAAHPILETTGPSTQSNTTPNPIKKAR